MLRNVCMYANANKMTGRNLNKNKVLKWVSPDVVCKLDIVFEKNSGISEINQAILCS